MNVEVVHVRNFGKNSKRLLGGGAYIYCGRPSALGNPFFMKDESQREEVIVKCDKDKNFHNEVQILIKWLNEWNIKDVKLGCYCAPKACHCDIIKREILHSVTGFEV